MDDEVLRLILALGKQRSRMQKSWHRLAVELAIKAIYEYENRRKMQWAKRTRG